jgi:hypothetical protein
VPERPDKICHLADELDRSGADERLEALEDTARRFSERYDVECSVHYTPIEIPADATVTVTEGFWPNGRPLTIRSYWDDVED